MRRLLLVLVVATLAGCGASDGADAGSADGSAGDDTASGEGGGRAEGGVTGADGAALDGSGDVALGPADGGGDASGGNQDAGAVDSASSSDGGTDANATSDAASDGGTVLSASACGDARGLQAGAPWPMRGRCPTRMARADVAGPARANLRWSQRIGPSDVDLVDYGSVVSSPVVAADGTIYVGTQGTGTVSSALLAFAPDGTPKWHYDTGAHEVRSGAVVRADGSVVFASADGTLVALEPSGQLRWSTSLGAQAFASPLVGPDGTIYMGTQSGLTALHPDGSIAWSKPGCTVGTGGASLQPDGSIRYNCQSALMVLLPSGASGTGNLSATDEDQIIYAPPTIGPGGEVWFAGLTSKQIAGISYFATLYSYSPATGLQKRQFDWDSTAFFNSPALLPDGEAVTGVPHPATGTQDAFGAAPLAGGFAQWATYAQRIEAQPSVDVDGNVYFVSGTTLVSLGPTGSPRWTASVDSGVQIGMAIGGDGTIYVGTVNGWLYAYGP